MVQDFVHPQYVVYSLLNVKVKGNLLVYDYLFFAFAGEACACLAKLNHAPGSCGWLSVKSSYNLVSVLKPADQ